VILPSFERRTILGLSIAGLIPFFALTHTVVARYRVSRQQLAAHWSARGERDLPHAPSEAVIDFETALSFGPERSDDRFRLAEALIRAREPVEARAQLLTLWTEQPGSGRINLELARLAAADDDVRQAVRYYHGAVDGSWDSGAATARRVARLEAAKLLLVHGERFRAQSELIALIDDLPADPGAITEVAALLVDAGATTRAKALLDRALALDTNDRTAARLAGKLAFADGDYRAARDYLRAADRTDAEAQQMLADSEAVLALDPYLRGLRAAERANRGLKALGVAQRRVQRCQEDVEISDDLSRRLAGARKQSVRTLTRDAEALDDVMALVFDVEKLQSPACGHDGPQDRALRLIAARRNGRAQ
jgi:predicted Zn-dependent protease